MSADGNADTLFSIIDLVNLAHGSLHILGAYFAATFAVWAESFVLAVVLALAVTVMVGRGVPVGRSKPAIDVNRRGFERRSA